jgi:DoxX-like family
MLCRQHAALSLEDPSMNSDIVSAKQQIILMVLRALVAFAFILFGTLKLIGMPMMVDVFDHVGLGQWFRYATGMIEVGGAILLLSLRFVGPRRPVARRDHDRRNHLPPHRGAGIARSRGGALGLVLGDRLVLSPRHAYAARSHASAAAVRMSAPGIMARRMGAIRCG